MEIGKVFFTFKLWETGLAIGFAILFFVAGIGYIVIRDLVDRAVKKQAKKREDKYKE